MKVIALCMGLLLTGCINGVRSNSHEIRHAIGLSVSETVFVPAAYKNYDSSKPALCISTELSYKKEEYYFLAKSICSDYGKGECDILYYKVNNEGTVVDAWFAYEISRQMKAENKPALFWCDERIRKGQNMDWRKWCAKNQ